MTENNSKHLITMNFGSYKLYIKDYKLFRSVKVSELSAFMSKKELCYTGFEHVRLEVTALIDKSRFGELSVSLESFVGQQSYSVVIDGSNIGNFYLTGYEICGSEDDYIYKASLSFCRSE